MDRSNEPQLFNTDANAIVMPTIATEVSDQDKENLISESIDSAILSKQVKTLILPEDTAISKLNYVIDVENSKQMSSMQKAALKSLISKNGDTQIYLYLKQSGLFSVGFGDRYKLERMMPILKKFVFDDMITIYKNFEIGKDLQEVTSKDITKMRINL